MAVELGFPVIQMPIARPARTVFKPRRAISPMFIVVKTAILTAAGRSGLHNRWHVHIYNPVIGGTSTASWLGLWWILRMEIYSTYKHETSSALHELRLINFLFVGGEWIEFIWFCLIQCRSGSLS
ncbi:hypothetical protein BJX96DRAFT_143939 [Aspergillus floccosus]